MLRNLQLSNVVFLLLLGAIGYGGVLAWPRYMDHVNVRKAVREAHQQAATASDEQLRALIRTETLELGVSHTVTDGAGYEHERPGLADEQIEIFRDAYSPTVRVRVELPCDVRLPLAGVVKAYDCGHSEEGVPGQT